jgi:flagellar biosynthesis protein FlhF
MKLKTYVGRSLEELAPQIREELGPDAVILSQRQGLKGGVGGFFSTKSIEVLAADRMPDKDAAQAQQLGEPAMPDTRQGMSEADRERAALVITALGEMRARQTPAVTAAAAYAAPVEELALPDFVGSMGPVELPAADPDPEPEPDMPLEPPAAEQSASIIVEEQLGDHGMLIAPRLPEIEQTPSSDDAIALLDELDRAGVATEIARAVVEAAERHLQPFQPATPLRDLVRARIRSIVRVEAGWGDSGQRTLAVAGPTGSGKTTVLLKLAERYCAAGLSVGVLALEPVPAGRTRMGDALDDSLTFDLRRAGSISAVRAARRAFAGHDIVLIDTPGSAMVEGTARDSLLTLLAECGIDELHAVLPLGMADRELAHVLSRLVDLGANRLLATKLDETRFSGALLTLAATSQLPLAYLSSGPRINDEFDVADGGSICDRILPIQVS